MTTLYTIGFTGKSAERFFALLEEAGVTRIVDTRISNTNQLAGFAKGPDLRFFARRIANIGYEHVPDFAPTKELLNRYRDKQLTWEEYAKEYGALLISRNIAGTVEVANLDNACLLCSEHLPHHCHRRLLAEFLQTLDPTLSVVHLK